MEDIQQSTIYCGWGVIHVSQILTLALVREIDLKNKSTVNVLRLLFIYNILESGYRLTRKEPDFSDLALTPMQRKLLGLPNG